MQYMNKKQKVQTLEVNVLGMSMMKDPLNFP